MKPLSKRIEMFTDSVIRRITRVCLGCGSRLELLPRIGQHLIRLLFAKREDTLIEALNRLESMKAKMS